MDESKLILGGSNWADENNIDLRLNQRVSEVLLNENAIIIENNNGDNEKQSADFLVVATGAEPKIPPFKGADLAGVFTLRSMSDAKAIKEASKISRWSSSVLGLSAWKLQRRYRKQARPPQSLSLVVARGNEQYRLPKRQQYARQTA